MSCFTISAVVVVVSQLRTPKDNTTLELVADIESIREHLGAETIYVSGGSWGSTLGLVYAIMHPNRVVRMVLWSIYLARAFDDNLVNSGYFRYSFPEAWERFIEPVPGRFRKSVQESDEVLRATDQSKATRKPHLSQRVGTRGSEALSSFDYDERKVEREMTQHLLTLSNARADNSGAACPNRDALLFEQLLHKGSHQRKHVVGWRKKDPSYPFVQPSTGDMDMCNDPGRRQGI